MNEPDWKGTLAEAFDHALGYLEGLPDRPIIPPATLAELRTNPRGAAARAAARGS